MFRRGMAGLTMAVTLVLGIAVPGALADTAPPPNADTYWAMGIFSDGEVEAYISVQIGKEEGVAFKELTVNTFSSEAITCKGKEGLSGDIWTNVSGVSVGTAAIKIDKKLGTATASDTLMLTKRTENTCTGKVTFGKPFKTTVSMGLRATTRMTSEKDSSEIPYEDGSTGIFNGRWDVRDAVGNLDIGASHYATAIGAIGHEVTTFVIIPPH